MAEKVINVNPVKATLMKYKDGNCGIQNINDTCYNICAGFSGAQSIWGSEENCAKQCDKLVEDMRVSTYGVGKCDHQAPYRPVDWGDVPRWVPTLVRQGVEPKKALNICRQKCMDVPNRVMECQEQCQTDFNAIEGYEKPELDRSVMTEKPAEHKRDNIIFIVGVSILAFMILCVFLLVLYNR